MSDVAIRVEGLGKRYAVARPATHDPHYTALRDVLAREARAVVRRTRDLLRGQPDDVEATESFWALRDVSFEVKVGERLGIIGRNGAGKSTLLKVLSRITDPTTGRIELRGRVASLLEVGTGFHPELTGRENIYLNGAVLGMTRAEIRRRFDEIVDFAEVERFLDTPVKRYSSGMYMRLAFAVAAHLEPEILVVDEVLAVGDAAFQRKCLGKMEAVGREGRTVLFVSHQMAAIERLCDRCLLLSNGQLDVIGDVAEVVRRHHAIGDATVFARDLSQVARRGGEHHVRFTGARTYSAGRETEGTLVTGAEVAIGVTLAAAAGRFRFDPHRDRLALAFSNENGVHIVLSSEMLADVSGSPETDADVMTFRIPRNPLTPGLYRMTLFLEVHGVVQDWITEGVYVAVVPGDYYGSGRLCPPAFEGKAVLVDFQLDAGAP